MREVIDEHGPPHGPDRRELEGPSDGSKPGRILGSLDIGKIVCEALVKRTA